MHRSPAWVTHKAGLHQDQNWRGKVQQYKHKFCSAMLERNNVPYLSISLQNSREVRLHRFWPRYIICRNKDRKNDLKRITKHEIRHKNEKGVFWNSDNTCTATDFLVITGRKSWLSDKSIVVHKTVFKNFIPIFWSSIIKTTASLSKTEWRMEAILKTIQCSLYAKPKTDLVNEIQYKKHWNDPWS